MSNQNNINHIQNAQLQTIGEKIFYWNKFFECSFDGYKYFYANGQTYKCDENDMIKEFQSQNVLFMPNQQSKVGCQQKLTEIDQPWFFVCYLCNDKYFTTHFNEIVCINRFAVEIVYDIPNFTNDRPINKLAVVNNLIYFTDGANLYSMQSDTYKVNKIKDLCSRNLRLYNIQDQLIVRDCTDRIDQMYVFGIKGCLFSQVTDFNLNSVNMLYYSKQGIFMFDGQNEILFLTFQVDRLVFIPVVDKQLQSQIFPYDLCGWEEINWSTVKSTLAEYLTKSHLNKFKLSFQGEYVPKLQSSDNFDNNTLKLYCASKPLEGVELLLQKQQIQEIDHHTLQCLLQKGIDLQKHSKLKINTHRVTDIFEQFFDQRVALANFLAVPFEILIKDVKQNFLLFTEANMKHLSSFHIEKLLDELFQSQITPFDIINNTFSIKFCKQMQFSPLQYAIKRSLDFENVLQYEQCDGHDLNICVIYHNLKAFETLKHQQNEAKNIGFVILQHGAFSFLQHLSTQTLQMKNTFGSTLLIEALKQRVAQKYIHPLLILCGIMNSKNEAACKFCSYLDPQFQLLILKVEKEIAYALNIKQIFILGPRFINGKTGKNNEGYFQKLHSANTLFRLNMIISDSWTEK